MPLPKKPIGPDLEMVRALAELMSQTHLTEFEYQCEEWSIRVGRAAPAIYGQAPSVISTPSVVAASAAEDAVPTPHPGLLTSPMVGVVYTSAEPDVPPFVRIGETVSVGDTVLLIEAMKVFNPISAHRAGRVTRIFVSNGMPVEFGEPLLIIE